MYGEMSSYLHLLFHIADILDCLEYEVKCLDLYMEHHEIDCTAVAIVYNYACAVLYSQAILRLGIKDEALREPRPLV